MTPKQQAKQDDHFLATLTQQLRRKHPNNSDNEFIKLFWEAVEHHERIDPKVRGVTQRLIDTLREAVARKIETRDVPKPTTNFDPTLRRNRVYGLRQLKP